jgi:hypothetical protein
MTVADWRQQAASLQFRRTFMLRGVTRRAVTGKKASTKTMIPIVFSMIPYFTGPVLNARKDPAEARCLTLEILAKDESPAVPYSPGSLISSS